MDSLIELFSQFSLEGVIIFVVLLLVCFKFLNELLEYVYSKLREHFNTENWRDQKHNEICHNIQAISEKVDSIDSKINKLDNRIDSVEKGLTLTQERLQENTRSRLIEARDRFCYQEKAIDEFSLSSLEREYMYYKQRGGNTFIDLVMEEIRSVPIINCSTAMLKTEHNPSLEEEKEEDVEWLKN